jgi:hypothetical protein
MTDPRCHCVFPQPTEEELVTIPGSTPNTALRVHVESSQDGYVRLEHLAYDAGMGWYVQKSFIIPAEMLHALLPHLRKADCLMPKRALHSPWQNDAPIRLFPNTSEPQTKVG